MILTTCVYFYLHYVAKPGLFTSEEVLYSSSTTYIITMLFTLFSVAEHSSYFKVQDRCSLLYRVKAHLTYAFKQHADLLRHSRIQL